MSAIDEISKRYGRWTVIERAGKAKDGKALWLCRCDCGNENIVSGACLRRGRSQSCGCSNVVDMIGQKWGRLTVLSRAGADFCGKATWLCRCDCGNEKVLRGRTLRNGSVRSCGCLRREIHLLAKGEAAFNAILQQMKQSAKSRHHEWALTDEQVRSLSTRTCHYCGAVPAQGGNAIRRNGVFLYNGIDRLDNKLGYIVGNVVPCCGTCNMAKRNMATTQFLSWVIAVYKYSCKQEADALPSVMFYPRMW